MLEKIHVDDTADLFLDKLLLSGNDVVTCILLCVQVRLSCKEVVTRGNYRSRY